jgi:hypothetical protein
LFKIITDEFIAIIEQAWENRALLQERNNRLVELLDAGKLQLLNQKETHGK